MNVTAQRHLWLSKSRAKAVESKHRDKVKQCFQYGPSKLLILVINWFFFISQSVIFAMFILLSCKKISFNLWKIVIIDICTKWIVFNSTSVCNLGLFLKCLNKKLLGAILPFSYRGRLTKFDPFTRNRAHNNRCFKTFKNGFRP